MIHIDVTFSLLTFRFLPWILYLPGIFDLELAFYKFNFDLDVTVLRFLLPCSIF